MLSSQQYHSPKLATSKAPAPSPALIALQEQGFELPTTSRQSTQSCPPSNQLLRVSPLSLRSASADVDKPLPLEPQELSRRTSSSYSADTTVTKIVQMYANKSQQSLRSRADEYDEMSPFSDDSTDDEPPPPTFHQPKAYRDTLVPLLQSQYTDTNLSIPLMPSPQSLISLPNVHLLSPSIVSLQLTLGNSPVMIASTDIVPADSNLGSRFSIQLTPESSPLIAATKGVSGYASQEELVSPVSKERQKSWFDQPVSPMSSADDPFGDTQPLSTMSLSPTSRRPSQQSIESPGQAQYNLLHPCSPKTLPIFEAIPIAPEDYLPEPISATLTHIVADRAMIPPPLDLSRSPSRSPNALKASETGVIQPEPNLDRDRQRPRKDSEAEILAQRIQKRHQKQISMPQTMDKLLPTSEYRPGHKAMQSSSYTIWPASTTTQQHDLPPNRPRSPLFPPNDAFVTDDTFGGHVKAIIKEKLDKNKKTRRKRKKERSSVELDSRGDVPSQADDESQGKPDFPQSFRPTRAWGHTVQRQDIQDLDDVNTNLCKPSSGNGEICSGPGPAMYSTILGEPQNQLSATLGGHEMLKPRRREKQAAIPLTPYQIYGAEIWNTSKRGKRKQERAAARRAAALENVSGQQRVARPGSATHIASQEQSNLDLRKNSSTLHDAGESDTGSKVAGADLVKKIFRSSEDKRRDKLKESITVVGGVAIGEGFEQRLSEDSHKELDRKPFF